MLFHCDHLSLDALPQGYLHLQLHHPSGHNVLDQPTLDGLSQAIAQAEHHETKGLILSSQHRHFCLGADIRSFQAWFASDDDAFHQRLATVHTLFSRIENLPYPMVSLLSGHVLGGGCELSLTTDVRFATTDLNIGLPEVKLGLLPGWGGCVRLPRLLGGDTALFWLTTGDQADAQTALAQGWVDAVLTDDPLNAAIDWLDQAQTSPSLWQTKRQQKQSPLPLSRTEFTLSLAVAQGKIQQTVGTHYPAPMRILQAYQQTALLPAHLGFPLERDHFIALARTPEAHSLIRVFLNQQAIKAQQAKHKVDPLRHAGVIGAGIMGSGIAYQSAKKGVMTTLLDLDETALAQAQAHWHEQWLKRHKRGKLSVEQWVSGLEHLSLSTQMATLGDCDGAVEAVTESFTIKAQVLKEAENYLPNHAILMSNTSTIPITELAKTLDRPQQFCGLHFFNPVDKMPLVEIVRGQQTHPNTLAKAAEYVSQMGKTAILVGDGPGFFVNRVLFPYLMAFSQLVDEGVSIPHIDKVMTQQFGWPMGPAYLLDVIGLDTAYHAQQVMATHYPDRMTLPTNNALTRLYQSQDFGQKSGQGFYNYQDKQPKLNPVWHQENPVTLSDKTLIERLMIPMLNEVGRCLEEGIIHSAAEADLALVYGLGFPAFRGGACHYLEQWGLSAFIDAAQAYNHLGGLYQTPQYFVERANQSHPFYGQ